MKATPLLAALVAAGFGLVALPSHADVPAPQNTPYTPGALQIHVDATDLAHRIFRVHEVVPAVPGPLTLLYPQWIPGHHSPTGPIDKLAGLVVKANGKTLTWKRDPYNVYAFQIDVPQGASSVEVDFQFLSPQSTREGRVVMTPEMLNLQWNTVSLYPAGYYAKQVQTQPSVTFPAGWQAGTALDVASRDGNTVHYKPINYDDLVDSPIYAGKYFKRIDLDPGAKAPVHMDIVADAAKDLEVTPEQVKLFRNMVQQMYKLYGAHHYNHYDFLVSLSDKMSGNGLEHHRSSEDGTSPDFFTAWKKNALSRDLFSHEFNHSWDGKYRRGADLATPNFNVPMGDTLLWVYEGQTQFWGHVIAARSGLWDTEQAHDMWAYVAATYDKGRPGLASWRNVQDTTNDPTIAQRAPLPYRNYQSSEDYYSAGQMIWLDVDGKLRELSHGKKSIDDFAKAFFGMDNGSWTVNPYTFDDVVKTLNGIAPFDWAPYLRSRLDGHGPLIGGIESHGWKLVYTDKPSDAIKAIEARRHSANLTYSLGVSVGKGGQIGDVLWDGPAFKAGLSPGMSIVAVNGHDYSSDDLRDAVTAAAKDKSQPIELLVKNFDEYKTIRIDYHDGLKYPHLVRDTRKPDTLGPLLKAL
ncbi:MULTISPECIES: M61 family metallopeptidase [Rhodanobacter]|uniref:Predicted metalloprotease, contains C-terminal PDZ domain n=1 Tax=Rhodanobacter glycinis TaxID=582702 RepID=A0A1I3Z7Z0_9GAMM|nr:M61 family metallopeptidase [Rhodanobacter glycinis]TAM27772.1 MAG: M61 family peptidase [Rhodanobacter sp.]SFK40185.1 Predicted metalloprotease, contains C-terminal PDZ domain [Rhodanobacter glycinis]